MLMSTANNPKKIYLSKLAAKVSFQGENSTQIYHEKRESSKTAA
jgi:hypothetical protein